MLTNNTWSYLMDNPMLVEISAFSILLGKQCVSFRRTNLSLLTILAMEFGVGRSILRRNGLPFENTVAVRPSVFCDH